jgi:biotin transport system substrate-specific component
MGMIPFLIGDIIKIGIAATITKAITPKQSYGKEIDTYNASP